VEARLARTRPEWFDITMEGYDASTYGEAIAGEYDRLYGGMFDVDSTVEFLAREAGKEPVLELGIGTGRIALPLAAREVEVHGVDSSAAMVAKLRAKPGGTDIPVKMGDFGRVNLGGPYSVVFVAFNTLFALTTKETQVECFRNVEKALSPTGVFVIEAFVPDLTRFDRDQRVQVNDIAVDHAWLDVSRHDTASQTILSQHIRVSESGIRMFPVSLRYAWPSELDLMAERAELRLRYRFGSWKRETFTESSGGHVSVYEKASVPE
jgi:SAM-dependent methyltransferase